MIAYSFIHIAELQRSCGAAPSTIFSDAAESELHKQSAELQGLYLRKLQCQKELETATILTEDKNRRAIQGKALMSEVQSHLEVLEDNMTELMVEIKQLLDEQGNKEQQLDYMQQGQGLQLWPIPQVNSAESTRTVSVLIKPCGYRKLGFQNFDVALTSCKHAFHPFCLCVMLKAGSRCFVCQELLHPNW